MKYALINDGIVTNTIALLPYNAKDFPNAIDTGDRPVQIGDTFDGEKFYREGKEVHTEVEEKDITIGRMNAAGAEEVQSAMQALDKEPPKSAGAFTYDEWTPGKPYERLECFTYNGIAGFTRQKHTAQEHQRPFTEGMSAIYGARPPQDAEGVYEYISSMRVDVGDKVRSAKDGMVYVCYANGADPLTYDPADAVSIFELA